MSKTLLEKIEEANRRPVPYEGLKLFVDGIVSYPSREEPQPSTTADNPSHKEAFAFLSNLPAKGHGRIA